MNFNSDQCTALDEFSVLHISGPEAGQFLQAQLTNSVDDLQPNQAVLAGYCQAKGRLQANLVLWPDPNQPEHFYALIHASIAERVVQRLKMFLLRTKAELRISPALVYGLYQSPTTPYSLPVTHLEAQHHQGYSLIAAPNANVDESPRAWLIQYQPQEQPIATERPSHNWLAEDSYAGLAWIQAHNYEAFLPQDINFDIIGGVSFKKGCFPGQEVVARLHYRTTARRRTALAIIASPQALTLQVGSDVYAHDSAQKPLGRIVSSDYHSQHQQQVLLIEILIADLEQKQLYLQHEEQPLDLQLRPLPYKWEIAKY